MNDMTWLADVMLHEHLLYLALGVCRAGKHISSLELAYTNALLLQARPYIGEMGHGGAALYAFIEKFSLDLRKQINVKELAQKYESRAKEILTPEKVIESQAKELEPPVRSHEMDYMSHMRL